MDVVLWPGLSIAKLKEEQIFPELENKNIDFMPKR